METTADSKTENTEKTEIVAARAAMKAAGEIESEACRRCGGSGKFSYCQMYGDTCFSCRGKGRTLTKRGAAAAAYLQSIRSKRADELVPGVDEIYCDPFGPLGIKGGYFMVESVKPYTAGRSSSMINGVWVEDRDLVEVSCVEKGRGLSGCRPDTLFRVRQSLEQSVETWIKAIEYQKTLGKNGKPAKRPSAG